MVSSDKHKAAGLDLVDALCESEDEESGKGEADGGDGKPAYSRKGCQPCTAHRHARMGGEKAKKQGAYLGVPCLKVLAYPRELAREFVRCEHNGKGK